MGRKPAKFVVTLFNNSEQWPNPQNGLTISHFDSGSGTTIGWVSSGEIGVHCTGTQTVRVFDPPTSIANRQLYVVT